VNKRILIPILTLCVLGGIVYLTVALISPAVQLPIQEPLLDGACTAFCLDNGDWSASENNPSPRCA
jgi:hypothetical protein